MLVLLNVSQEEVPLVKHYVSVAKCEPRRGTLSKTLCLVLLGKCC